MANETLPNYLGAAKANPIGDRAPWYKNTAPAYAGIFLSVPFMAGMAGALQYGSISAAVIGLLIGALFCLVIYYVPAKLGMTTGMPLYVVASSTFGAKGAIFVPGLLMGLVQIFWHAVFTFSAASFFMQAINRDPAENQMLFWIACAAWGLVMAFVGAIGIGWLGWLSSWLPIFPLLIILVAAVKNAGGLCDFSSVVSAPEGTVTVALGLAMFAALQATAGFFASAGVAGTDFGMNSRNNKDVILGGFFGITVAACVAGILAIVAIAGAIGKNPDIATMKNFAPFFASIDAVGGTVASVASWVFVIACICPTGFCAFIASNAFSTMLPKLPRIPMTLAVGAVGVVLAASGVAGRLIDFFLIVGASFGPLAGAMLADYVRNGKWSGPRKGINFAGYIAWALGFIVGILHLLPAIGFSYGLGALMSFIVGFAVYLICAEFGLEPESVELHEQK